MEKHIHMIQLKKIEDLRKEKHKNLEIICTLKENSFKNSKYFRVFKELLRVVGYLYILSVILRL